ncbi:MAG: hypothetical protein EA402_13795 [Planctomycetota bacterium]|nr:MAG: hypothetical protein EA402_13795 [Planctomycetota bacterium]
MSTSRRIALGSQYYINKDSTVLEVRQGIAEMAAQGLRLVRIFAIWDHLEPAPGQYHWEVYDALFDAAAEAGLGVVPTLFAVSPPGWMGISDDSQALGPLEDPDYWRQALDHLRRVVEHWRDHPALHSWILWNEPSRVPPSSPLVSERWQHFLQQRYGSLEALNANRYRQVSEWSKLSDFTATNASAFRGYAQELDRLRFCVDELQHWLHDLAAAVRALDARHPIHVNPHNVGQSVLAAGQSVWREGELVDFIGVSAHPPWHATRFPAWRVPHAVEFFADIAASASCDDDGRFWVSELQGGPTIFSAEHPSGPSPREIKQWLQQSLAGGAEAVLFWCYNQRNGGYEVGEWGLRGLDGRPSERLAAVAEVAQFIEAQQPLLAAAQPWPASVAILHSEDSERLALLAGRGDAPQDGRNRNGHWDAIAGAWLIARDLGHEVQIIDEDRWCAGEEPASSVRSILVPAAHALRAETLGRLQAFAMAGGQVIADGLVGWNTADGRLADDQGLASCFGVRLHDLRGLRPDLPAPSCSRLDNDGPADNGGGRLHGLLFTAHLQPCSETVEILAHWPHAAPAISRQAQGEGCFVRLGTLVFAQYLAWDAENTRCQDLRQALQQILPAPVAPLQLAAPAPPWWLRRLQTPEGCLALLVNHGLAGAVELCAAAGSRIADLCNHSEATIPADGRISYHLQAGECRWLLLQQATAARDA